MTDLDDARYDRLLTAAAAVAAEAVAAAAASASVSAARGHQMHNTVVAYACVHPRSRDDVAVHVRACIVRRHRGSSSSSMTSETSQPSGSLEVLVP